MDKHIMDMTLAEVLEKSKELLESLYPQLDAMDLQISEAYKQRVIAEEIYDSAEDKTEAAKVYDDAEDKYWDLQNKQDDLNCKRESLAGLIYGFKYINDCKDLVDLADVLGG